MSVWDGPWLGPEEGGNLNTRQSGAMDFADLDQRRKTSLNKVRNAWKSIIKKYSALSETQQGDVVDITTGEIIKDMGHLRSLRQDSDGVWAETYTPPLAARRGAGAGTSDDDDDDDDENGGDDGDDTGGTRTGGMDPRRKKKGTGKMKKKKIEIIDLESPSRQRRRMEQFHSQPGDTSYIVSSSQHMTRSKVVGNDNLVVGGFREHKSLLQDKTYRLQQRQCQPRLKRSGLLDRTSNDPLNLLSSCIDLGTPSKVRRLRRALDQSYGGKRKLNDERRHLHKLILQEKLGSK